METTDADDAADDEDDDDGGGNSGGWSWHLVSRYISSISRRPLLCRQPPSVSLSCISESPLLTFGCASDVDEGTAGVPPKQPMQRTDGGTPAACTWRGESTHSTHAVLPSRRLLFAGLGIKQQIRHLSRR